MEKIEKIRQKIAKSGLKKSFIADKIGVSNTQLSNYLHGTRPMPDEIGKKLTAFLT